MAACWPWAIAMRVVGDGAVAGTGAECSSDTHIRVTVEKGMNIASPKGLDAGAFCGAVLRRRTGPGHETGCAGNGGLPGAAKKGMAPYDAYTLCSLAGDVRVSRTFRPISPVKMMLSRQALEQLG